MRSNCLTKKLALKLWTFSLHYFCFCWIFFDSSVHQNIPENGGLSCRLYAIMDCNCLHLLLHSSSCSGSHSNDLVSLQPEAFTSQWRGESLIVSCFFLFITCSHWALDDNFWLGMFFESVRTLRYHVCKTYTDCWTNILMKWSLKNILE